MADMSCYMTTFNCGRTLVDVNYFSQHFFQGLKTNLPPDLVVLSLQEIAPIGYSFLGGSFLAPYFTRFTTAVHAATAKRFESESDYETLIVRNVGMTAIMMFVRRSVEERIKWIETAGVGVGWQDAGNKGAVAVRAALESEGSGGEEVILTFVAAHLAPMEDAWQRRNDDWKNICRGLVFERDEPGSLNSIAHNPAESEPLSSSLGNDEARTLFSPNSHIFFSGDLNYRTSDTNPKLEDFENWPQPVDTVSDIHHFSHLLECDQLNRERRKGNTLHHLAEADITFPPTYKYSTTAQKRATQASLKQEVNEDRVWLWAKHRVPSWCDRVLYLEKAPPTVQAYTALPIQPTSDHRPVALSFSIPLKPLKPSTEVKPPFPIREDWRAARAAGRRVELIVGIAAYLTLTWEGEALLGGTIVGIIGGYLVLQALI